MAAKEFRYRNKTVEELKKMEIKEFAKLVPARQRRSLTRGFTDPQKRLLAKVKNANDGKFKKPIKTHCRDLVILPSMIGLMIHIHKGKGYAAVNISEEMVGHFLGEFAHTRSNVKHSAPGIGATRSSQAASVK